MLVLMGGGNIIECQIARHVKGGADPATLQNAEQSDAILFLGTEEERGCVFTCFLRILDQGDEKGIGRTVAKTAGKDWKGLVAEVTLRDAQQLKIFGIASDALG